MRGFAVQAQASSPHLPLGGCAFADSWSGVCHWQELRHRAAGVLRPLAAAARPVGGHRRPADPADGSVPSSHPFNDVKTSRMGVPVGTSRPTTKDVHVPYPAAPNVQRYQADSGRHSLPFADLLSRGDTLQLNFNRAKSPLGAD